MKKTLLFVLLCGSLFAQSYNLSSLKSVKIEIQDDYALLNKQTRAKLEVETKLKLISAGMKVDYFKPIASLQIKINLNKSAELADPRIHVELDLLEKVQTFRNANVRTDAKTYSNSILFACPAGQVNEYIYKYFLDKLFLEFIDKWLEDNPN